MQRTKATKETGTVKLSAAQVLKKYFEFEDMRTGVRELKGLSAVEKLELARAAAIDMGLQQNQVDFRLSGPL